MEIVKNFLRKLVKGRGIAPLYTNREERSEFIYKVFKNYLKNSILDVGCNEGYLKRYISQDIKYVGIDIDGEPDFIVDLEKDKLTIFEDKSFDVVICTEVLEHLDNLYDVFDELTRISRRYIIISLPNLWSFIKFPLIKGKTKEDLKFYGLPKEKPLDRHKWFFNYDDALEFLKYRSEINNFMIKATFPTPIFYSSLRNSLLDFIFKIYYNNNYGFNNIHYRFIWALLKRKNI